jgi:hypothetical protein
MDVLGQGRSFAHAGRGMPVRPDHVVVSIRTTLSQVLYFSYTSRVRKDECIIDNEN